jgi:hypothetical protein
MNTGIQDACNLGWKLALAARDQRRGYAARHLPGRTPPGGPRRARPHPPGLLGRDRRQPTGQAGPGRRGATRRPTGAPLRLAAGPGIPHRRPAVGPLSPWHGHRRRAAQTPWGAEGRTSSPGRRGAPRPDAAGPGDHRTPLVERRPVWSCWAKHS